MVKEQTHMAAVIVLENTPHHEKGLGMYVSANLSKENKTLGQKKISKIKLSEATVTWSVFI